MPENNNEQKLNVQGTPDRMIPENVNVFGLTGTEDGFILDCMYRPTPQPEQESQQAFLSRRFIVSEQNLKQLADLINRMLETAGWIEHPSNNH